MSPWTVAMPWLPAMAVLILASAFFSGSEAAFFSLQTSDRADDSDRKRSLAVGRLLQKPERLLSAILFWNLLINMAYFAVASIVGTQLREIGEAYLAIGFTILSLLVIIFFSEMLPKSIAVSDAERISGVFATPLEWAVYAISPILPFLNTTNVIAQRLLWPSFRAEPELAISDIDRAIQLSAPDENFADRERQLLRRLVSLADTRVNEWMRPRSQLHTYQLPLTNEPVLESREDGYLFVGPSDSDEIDGVIAVQWLRPSQLDDPESVIEPPMIVPWSMSVASVFEKLREQKRSIAAVVNEYGQTVGVLSIDDILYSILADPMDPAQRSENAPEALKVSGTLSVRELAKQLGIEPPQGKNVTVAGLMQSLRRRIPRIGDTCEWKGYELTVADEDSDGLLIVEVQRSDRATGGEE